MGGWQNENMGYLPTKQTCPLRRKVGTFWDVSPWSTSRIEVEDTIIRCILGWLPTGQLPIGSDVGYIWGLCTWSEPWKRFVERTGMSVLSGGADREGLLKKLLTNVNVKVKFFEVFVSYLGKQEKKSVGYIERLNNNRQEIFHPFLRRRFGVSCQAISVHWHLWIMWVWLIFPGQKA